MTKYHTEHESTALRLLLALFIILFFEDIVTLIIHLFAH